MNTFIALAVTVVILLMSCVRVKGEWGFKWTGKRELVINGKRIFGKEDK